MLTLAIGGRELSLVGCILQNHPTSERRIYFPEDGIFELHAFGSKLPEHLNGKSFQVYLKISDDALITQSGFQYQLLEVVLECQNSHIPIWSSERSHQRIFVIQRFVLDRNSETRSAYGPTNFLLHLE